MGVVRFTTFIRNLAAFTWFMGFKVSGLRVYGLGLGIVGRRVEG